jgi:hypothetical protein
MSSPEDEEAGSPLSDAVSPDPNESAGPTEDAASVPAADERESASPPDHPASFVVRCAVCGAETSVTTDQAGKRGRCGVCGGTFLILPPPGFGPVSVGPVEPPEVPPFDGPPHRAGLILSLGLTAMLALALAVVITSCCPYVPVDLIGVGVGIVAWVMGRRDLKAMDRGAMDPAGREKTRLGYALGICAAAFGLFLVLLRFAIFGIIFLMIFLGPRFKPPPPGGFAPPPPPTAVPTTSPAEAKEADEPVVPPNVQGLDR